jgi:hypothetical protein
MTLTVAEASRIQRAKKAERLGRYRAALERIAGYPPPSPTAVELTMAKMARDALND